VPKPITLVLGGTGVKGITSIGVLQSFHTHDIKIKKIISSGISSLISAQFALGDDPDILTERFIHFFEGNNRSIWGLEQASGLLMSPRTHLAGNLSYYLRERSYCHANFQNNSILSWESADPMINTLFDNKSFSDLKIHNISTMVWHCNSILNMHQALDREVDTIIADSSANLAMEQANRKRFSK
jgi:predicted acylesterase/phospholipase RssA